MKIIPRLSPSTTLLSVTVLALVCHNAEAQGNRRSGGLLNVGRDILGTGTTTNQNTRQSGLGGLLNPVTSIIRNTTTNLLSTFQIPEDPQLLTKLLAHPNFLFDATKDFGIAISQFPGMSVIRELVQFEVAEYTTIGRANLFSPFHPYHQATAAKLVNVFMGLPDVKLLMALAVAIRESLNPQLFCYCLSIALLHRPDTRNVTLPALVTNMPYKFIHRKTLQALGEQSRLGTGSRADRCLRQPATTTDKEEEPLAYFREDIGTNLHHWYWHLIYPFQQPVGFVKDRQGELFYFMHSEMVSRYNFERFSNGLKKAVPLDVRKQRIPQGYRPGIDLAPDVPYEDRAKNDQFTDFIIPDNRTAVLIQEMQASVKNIEASINSKTIRNSNGTTTTPPPDRFIDILGDLVEASDKSPNKPYYGDLHNNGHFAIGLAHDPQLKRTTNFGVMMDTTTAMRDPVFYRWHTFIDDLFDSYKKKLPAYTAKELGFDGVEIKSVAVETGKGRSAKKNEFMTYMARSELEVYNATDTFISKPITVCYTHLQHQPFTYNIEVKSNRKVKTAVRIFLAPTFDPDLGKDFNFVNQRKMFIQLDKFVAQLNSGTTVIQRRSVDSSVTVPTSQTFQRVTFDANDTVGTDRTEKLAYTGCGWPDYLLLPKGTPEGLASKLFVILTDWKDDEVQGSSMQVDDNRAAPVYCGIRDGKYPYKRPMGYPFDRSADSKVGSLKDFVRDKKNMYVLDTSIKFKK